MNLACEWQAVIHDHYFTDLTPFAPCLERPDPTLGRRALPLSPTALPHPYRQRGQRYCPYRTAADGSPIPARLQVGVAGQGG